MSVSAVAAPPIDPATFVVGYEALRASFLGSRASPAMRLGIQRMMAGRFECLAQV